MDDSDCYNPFAYIRPKWNGCRNIRQSWTRKRQRTRRRRMNSNTDIARQLAERYGIVDEGEIVELMDLEGRAELSEKECLSDNAD